MALIFHRALDQLSRLRLKASAAFWLQSGACAVVAWSLLHGGITFAPAARTAAANASAKAMRAIFIVIFLSDGPAAGIL